MSGAVTVPDRISPKAVVEFIKACDAFDGASQLALQNLISEEFRHTAACMAARVGKLDILQWLVQRYGLLVEGVSLCYVCLACCGPLNRYEPASCRVCDILVPLNATLCHAAAAGGNTDVMAWLLSKGATLSVLDDDFKSPLYRAVVTSELPAVKWLIEVANCDYLSANHAKGVLTPLMAACLKGKQDIVQYLLTLPAVDPHAVTKGGLSLLHLACSSGNLQLAQMLHARFEFDPRAVGSFKHTVCQCACDSGNVQLLQWLGSVINPVYPIAAIKEEIPAHKVWSHAASSKSLDMVKFIADECGYPMYYKKPVKPYTVHCVLDGAIQRGAFEMVKWAVDERGFNPAMHRLDMTTRFREVCTFNDLETVQWFADRYVGGVLADSEEEALRLFEEACGSGRLDVVQWIRDSCLWLDELCEEDLEPCWYAAVDTGNGALLEWFLSPSGCGLTPSPENLRFGFGMACTHSVFSSVLWCLDQYPHLINEPAFHITSTKCLSPVRCALNVKSAVDNPSPEQLECVKLLIERGSCCSANKELMTSAKYANVRGEGGSEHAVLAPIRLRWHNRRHVLHAVVRYGSGGGLRTLSPRDANSAISLLTDRRLVRVSASKLVHSHILGTAVAMLSECCEWEGCPKATPFETK